MLGKPYSYAQHFSGHAWRVPSLRARQRFVRSPLVAEIPEKVSSIALGLPSFN